MAIRNAQINPALGLPGFYTAHALPTTVALGTITEGFDDVTSTTSEYIFLQSPAAVAIGDDLTYDANYLGTKVAADAGQVDAIVASGAGVGAWFRLKARRAGP